MAIHSFDSRDFVFWEAYKDHFQATDKSIYAYITALHNETISSLKKTNIKYSELKNTLTPQKKRKEVGFIFDSARIENDFYGGVVLQHLIRAVSEIKRTTVSFGDITAGGNSHRAQLNIREAMREEVIFSNELQFKHATQFFVVYFNNLSAVMIEQILEELKGLDFFVGYCDFTYNSYLKDAVSMSIGQQFLLHDGKVLLRYIEGDPKGTNNTIFDFTKTDLEIVSIDEFQYCSFLTYKIKRRYFEMDNSDQAFSINSVYPETELINSYELVIEDNKFQYLLENKAGSLKKAGGDTITKDQLKQQIAANINTNYLFNLDFNEHGCLKFNTDLEFYDDQKQEMARCIASFEVIFKNKQIRLITLY